MSRILWLRAILVVSLAFNCALLFIYFTDEPMHDTRTPEWFVARVTRHMSAEDADAVRQTFLAHQTELNEANRTLEESNIEVGQAMTAEPFRMEELKKALDDAHAARFAMGGAMQSAIIDAVAKISPAGRQKLLPPPRDRH